MDWKAFLVLKRKEIEMDTGERFGMALLLPFLAVATVVAYAGGLGVLFIVVHESSLGEWGVIVIGVILVVAVPSIAAISERVTERK